MKQYAADAHRTQYHDKQDLQKTGQIAVSNETIQKERRATYNPNHLLDALMQHLGISSDGALSRRLKIARQVIANIRRGTVPVCASMLLWMQEASGIDVNELRRLLGDRRAKYRLSISIRKQPRPA